MKVLLNLLVLLWFLVHSFVSSMWTVRRAGVCCTHTVHGTHMLNARVLWHYNGCSCSAIRVAKPDHQEECAGSLED